MAVGAETFNKETVGQSQYKFLIFDFHGTMTDHQLRLIKAMHQAGHKAFGEHLDKAFYQEVLTRPSKASENGSVTNNTFIEEKFAREHTEREITVFLDEYRSQMDKLYIPIPGIRKVIKKILNESIEMVVLTNGRNREVVQNELRNWEFTSLADNLYSSHVTGTRKPNPKAIEYILRDKRNNGLEFKDREILVVGDYRDDMQTAQNMGLDSVLMIRGNGWETFKVRDPRPTYIISDPMDILKIVHGEVSKGVPDFFHVEPLLWRNDNWGPVLLPKEQ